MHCTCDLQQVSVLTALQMQCVCTESHGTVVPCDPVAVRFIK
ncbi:hypothetical protein AB205_0056880 [Aquarana catesbeiana]|uniref:Uncharacterized protein n=1 Tax=Aquarana catesbeiana TaxID=8400 RepID=A0A2G9R5Q9_AQUCT|nr:hypothetical protein AB205_0056880 [Aquarana catesbeiana]